MRSISCSIPALIFGLGCFGQGRGTDRAKTNKPDSQVQILHTPKAKYPPQDAGTVCIRGTVTLRVQFRFDGTIGKIIVIKGLPYGLTESAVEAARMIQFLPEIKGGYYVTASRLVSFTFDLY